MKYEQLIEGEWFEIVDKRLHQQCCDCGLIHRWRYKIKDGKIYAMGRLDNRATAAVRRAKKNAPNK